jgi:proton glutamate symport protein
MRLPLHWQILIAMLAGGAIGLALNSTLGERDDEVRLAPDRPLAGRVLDSTNRIEIQVYGRDERGQPTGEVVQHVVIDPSLTQAEILALRIRGIAHFHSINQLASSAEHQRAHQLLLAGRSWARWLGDGSKLLGDLFLRLLKMVSVPLIITSLITGITSLGHAERLGKMFGRTVLYYLSTSLLAIFTGLALVNLIQPGRFGAGLAAPDPGDVAERMDDASVWGVLYEQVQNVIPENPLAAAAQGNFLSIIAFSILIGIFAIVVGGRAGETISRIFSAGFEVMMAMTQVIIRLAPWGVFFFMLSAIATQGLDILRSLAMYMLTVAAALIVHGVVVLPLILWFIGRRNPRQFAAAMSPALLTAFSTSSSNGTLPLTLTSLEQRAGVDNRVSSFVVPLGATVNMDGTALYEVIAVLFIAQFSGIELSLVQQVIVVLTALAASIGAAGIPQAGLVMMVIILQAVGLPTENQALIIAVDRILDMGRTSVNVWSDACGAAVIARFETGGAERAAAADPLVEEIDAPDPIEEQA